MLSLLRYPSVRVPLLYLAIALPWVLATDILVRTATPSVEIENILASVKGIGFVVVTTVVLHVGIRRSTAALVEARTAAEASEERFRSLVSSLDDLVFMTDGDQRFTALLGPATTPEDRARFVGRTAVEIFGSGMGEAYQELGRRVLAGESLFVDWFRETAPTTFPVRSEVTSMRSALSPLRDHRGRIVGVVGVGRDTSRLRDLEREHEAAQARITRLVNYDVLTGLPNRTLMESRVEEAVAHARYEGHGAAVHLLDLDTFRDINDSLGHEVGDELLRAVADRLRRAVGPDDTVARLAGDEFVVVQRVVREREDAAVLARGVLAAFDHPFPVAGQEIYLTASLGIACYPDDGEDGAHLVRAADAAMYDAKTIAESHYAFFRRR